MACSWQLAAGKRRLEAAAAGHDVELELGLQLGLVLELELEGAEGRAGTGGVGLQLVVIGVPGWGAEPAWDSVLCDHGRLLTTPGGQHLAWGCGPDRPSLRVPCRQGVHLSPS